MTRRLIGLALAGAALVWTAAMTIAAPEETAIAASHLSATPQAAAPARRVDFERQVQPIIADHCLECHSQDKRKGGLSLATYADALDGGRNGPAIRPGNSARSLLLHRITGVVEPQMPKDEDPLTPAQIAFWDMAFAQALQAQDWKQDLANNAWAEDLKNAAETRKHLDSEQELIARMLGELGLLKR